jgi:ATP-dependent Lhr-like helicase
MPLHILAQQLMALALQQGGIGISSWRDWIGRMPGLAALDRRDVERVIRHMLSSDVLSLNDGVLWFGKSGERKFGRRNFMELLSSFTSEPQFTVRYGRQHLGSVDRSSFTLRHDKPQVLLLGGRSWLINQIDWDNRLVFVEPSSEEGKSRWLGSGQPLAFEFCQAIKSVLEGAAPECEMSKRAITTLQSMREDFRWSAPGKTTLLVSSDGARWWTFGGLLANATLAELLRRLGVTIGKADNFAIRIEDRNASTNWDSIIAKLRSAPEDQMVASVDSRTLAQLKFSTCLPDDLATKELESRLSDSGLCAQLIRQPASVVLET